LYPYKYKIAQKANLPVLLLYPTAADSSNPPPHVQEIHWILHRDRPVHSLPRTSHMQTINLNKTQQKYSTIPIILIS